MENFNRFIQLVRTLDIRNVNGVVNLYHYAHDSAEFEAPELIRLQQLSVSEILSLDHEKIIRHLARLKTVEASFERFWNSLDTMFTNGNYDDVIEYLNGHFIIPQLPQRGKLSKRFFNDLGDAITYKEAVLSSFIDQVEKAIQPEKTDFTYHVNQLAKGQAYGYFEHWNPDTYQQNEVINFIRSEIDKLEKDRENTIQHWVTISQQDWNGKEIDQVKHDNHLQHIDEETARLHRAWDNILDHQAAGARRLAKQMKPAKEKLSFVNHIISIPEEKKTQFAEMLKDTFGSFQSAGIGRLITALESFDPPLLIKPKGYNYLYKCMKLYGWEIGAPQGINKARKEIDYETQEKLTRSIKAIYDKCK